MRPGSMDAHPFVLNYKVVLSAAAEHSPAGFERHPSASLGRLGMTAFGDTDAVEHDEHVVAGGHHFDAGRLW